MSRKVFIVVSAIIMAVLAVVVARFFQEPYPVADAPIPAAVEPGGQARDPADQAEIDPVAQVPQIPQPPQVPQDSLSSPVPPMPVAEVRPGETASGPAASAHRAAGEAPVTQAPRPVPAPTREPVSTPAVTPAAPSVAEAPTREPATPTVSAPVPPPPAVPELPAPSEQAATPVTTPREAPAETTSTASGSGTAATAEPAPARSGRTVLTTRSSLPAKAGQRVITSAVLSMDGDVVTLRLEGSQNISGKAFLLNNPHRAVLDLVGAWHIEPPRVTSNRMVKELRTGKPGDTTRIVFDMKVKPSRVNVTQVNAQTLELKIR